MDLKHISEKDIIEYEEKQHNEHSKDGVKAHINQQPKSAYQEKLLQLLEERDGEAAAKEVGEKEETNKKVPRGSKQVNPKATVDLMDEGEDGDEPKKNDDEPAPSGSSVEFSPTLIE